MLSPLFADLLRAGRPQFNARVAEARHRYPGFNTDAFGDFLHSGVDPLVNAAATTDAQRAGAVAVAAFDTALDLVGRELVGLHPHCAAMNRLWSDILPACTHAILDKPALVLGALSNALVNLENCQAREEQWLHLIRTGCSGLHNSEQVLQLGVLAAWRAGAAHFRPAALQATQQLPADAVAKLLDLHDVNTLDTLLKNIAADPWYVGSKHHQVGAFSGFGGLFPEPPQVRVNQGQFMVMSGGRCHLLMADGCGVVLLPASRDEFEQGEHDKPLKKQLTMGELALPESGLRVTENDHSLAITSPFTFAIHVTAR